MIASSNPRSRSRHPIVAPALALALVAAVVPGGTARASSGLEEDAPAFPSPIAEAAYWFAHGKMLAEGGEFDAARESYDRALELRDDDPYGFLELARFHDRLAAMSNVREERFEHLLTAADFAVRARDLAPEEADVLRVFAGIHVRLGEYRPEAVEAARSVLEELRGSGDADFNSLVQLGQLYRWLRRPSEAADVLTEAESLLPGHRMVRQMRLEALLMSGRASEATPDLAAALEDDPSNLDYRLNLADVLAQEGQLAEAERVLREAPANQRNNPRWRRSAALHLHLLGRHDEARDALGDLGRDGGEPEVVQLRASILVGLLQYTEAERLLAPLAEGGAPPTWTVVRTARLRERTGDSRGAEDLLRRHLETPDDEAERLQLRIMLAEVLERSGRVEKAADLLRSEIRRADGDRAATLAAGLADVFARNERLEDARKVLEKAAAAVRATEPEIAVRLEQRVLELLADRERWSELLAALDSGLGESDLSEAEEGRTALRATALAGQGHADDALALLQPDTPQRRALRAEILLDADRLAEATAELEALAETGLEAQILAAQILHRAERYGAAIERMEALPSEAREGDSVRFLYGAALERVGRIDESVRTFRKLLEERPDHAPAANYLGYTLAVEGRDLEEARELVEGAVAQQPDNGAYVDSLGWIYHLLGRSEEALPHLEWAAALVRDDATLLFHLGEVYEALGRRAEAVHAWRRASRLEGEDAPRAAERLEELGP